jgi:hypothetical protein
MEIGELGAVTNCTSSLTFATTRVISLTVSSPDISYIEYTRMPALIYQYVTNLVVSLPIRNVSVREHRALNN